ncbi:MAG: CvpA family protein [Spirochaetaceae bacterium]|jgi:membrane protein required for colicin V production|nr:CvpA family protein [Spirochaetaceae bacterium]
MEVIDIIFMILMVILIVRCALRGFVEEVMSMSALVLGLGSAFFFHKKGAAFLVERYIPDVKILPEVLAFAAVFLIVFLAVKLLESILKDIVDRIHLGGVNRFLGAVFGFIEGVVLVSVVLFVLSIQPLVDTKPLLEKSYFAQTLSPYIGAVKNAVQLPGGV